MVTKSDTNKYLDSVTILIEIHAKDGEEAVARQAFTWKLSIPKHSILMK